ncbi:DUF2971 domain-containing protein [Succinatimonas hippei]|uniref:DUF2971 domain-containing protein n=1 Tax=Succinatimonas hippei TaxID=626938 RepID=UPI002493B33C|nr:DUF2971 domain-containing protein [Succinatimonas hippei]
MSCIVYHYCSFDTLKKILESQCFWLTSHKYMNDVRERIYAFYLVNKKLETLRKKLNQQQRQNLQQFFYLLDISFKKLIPETFMCCFSRIGDELPQWYQYANDGDGVALGIDVEEITKHHRPPFANGSTDESLSYCELIYEQTLQDNLIDEWLDKASHFEFSDSNGSEQINLNYLMQCYVFLFKDPKYSYEKEIRLACSVLNRNMFNNFPKDNPLLVKKGSPLKGFFKRIVSIEDKKFVVDNNHHQIKFKNHSVTSEFITCSFSKQCVKSIIIGPRFDKITELESFLRLHGFDHVKLIGSECNFRLVKTVKAFI